MGSWGTPRPCSPGTARGIGSSISYLAVGAIGYPVGAGIMLLTADKIERKYLLFGATIVWLTGMLLIWTLANGAVVTVGSFLASLALGSYLQVAYTFTAENFPTGLRPADSPWRTEAGTWAGLWAPSCYP
jgi:MFS family permease